MGGVRTSRPTVLTVDDEPGVRESVRLILEEAYAVEEASSGWGAIEQIRGRKPDIVLLDVKMPDLDGLSVLEIVRAEAPATKIVLLTGLDSARAAVTAMKLGALDYLTKPIDEDELLEVVSRAVRSTEIEPALNGEICVTGDHAGWRSVVAALLRLVGSARVTTRSLDRTAGHVASRLMIVDVIGCDHPGLLAGLGARAGTILVWADGGAGAALVSPSTSVTVFRTRDAIGDLVAHALGCLGRPASQRTMHPSTVRALHVIAQSYATVTVESLAGVVGLSTRQLSRIIREDIGVTLKTCLTHVRLEAAKTLLRESSSKLDTVAAQVGLGNASYMTRVFQQFEGVSPRGFRTSVRMPPQPETNLLRLMSEKD
jgi:DNA-binding response OmpR family regulator/AraC-like DNA-binding protein